MIMRQNTRSMVIWGREEISQAVTATMEAERWIFLEYFFARIPNDREFESVFSHRVAAR